ncbi:MAG: GlyGly-CTERM sorting domain-containing protein [Exiguobacterium sp.]
MADGIVTVNPFILLSPIWTLVAVLSGGALSLFTLALLCWCCCRRPEQTY